MNRSSFSLAVALLIHLVFLLIFWILGSTIEKLPKNIEKEKKVKILLKELVKEKKLKNIIKPKEEKKIPREQPDLAPPMIKGSQLKEITNKKVIKYDIKKSTKTPKLNPKKTTQTKKTQIVTKKISKVVKENLIPLPIKEEKKQTSNTKKKVKKEEKNSLNWLYEDKTMYETQDTVEKKFSKTAMGKNIQELYGSKFGELTKAQQEYILDNQEIMRRITQQVLTRQARVSNLNGLNVNRSNIIEFYLHPNGDMSDFKFLEKSGYFILDEITRVTIQYAYSKYPRPKEKTLIRYNVFYNLKSY